MPKLIQPYAAYRLSLLVPCLAVIVFVDRSLHAGTEIPAPFILVLLTVVFAGAVGGLWTGLLSGLASSALLAHAYFEQFGTDGLTGSLGNTLFACVVFTWVGVFLGRFRDRQAGLVTALKHQESNLRRDLSNETQEKDTQAELVRASEKRLQRAVRVANIGHFTWDARTGTCSYCSNLYSANFGLSPEDFIERSKGQAPFIDLIHEDDRASFVAAVQEVDLGRAMEIEYRAARTDGTFKYIRQYAEPVFDDAGNVIETVGCTIDLTNLRETEARLRQSQRIEAIGTLTGGVAHDFNNLLAVIMGGIELTMSGGRLSDEQGKNLGAALAATKRGADLSKNLLSFARRAPLNPTRVDLNTQVQSTIGWALRALPTNISVENSFMAGLWDTEVDVTSLDNAIINLLFNARDAMEEGGKVTIETSNMRVGSEYITERGEDIEPGHYVMLAITDTGHGIPSESLESIFEPFYTEKTVGMGSGLGLSMVQGFMKQSGGAVRVYSEVGVGTTFKLYFRAATGLKEPEISHPINRVEHNQDALQILLAEDEEAVSRVLGQMMQQAGHRLSYASSGDAALEAYKAAKHIDLLITDVVMPGTLQGPALAQEVRLINPNLPCIFLSGYAAEATVHCSGLKPSDIRLMKPVSRLDLMEAIARATKPN